MFLCLFAVVSCQRIFVDAHNGKSCSGPVDMEESMLGPKSAGCPPEQSFPGHSDAVTYCIQFMYRPPVSLWSL